MKGLEVDPECPLGPDSPHGWDAPDECICLPSWLRRLAEEADEAWLNEPYMPWEN